MKWLCRSPGLSLVLLTATLCSLTQGLSFSLQSFPHIRFRLVECRIRRRRQYISNNYGAYAIDPPVASFYGTGGGGSYTGNSQNSNRFIVGGVAYQYPTPVNVMSGGSYNPREYNAWPSGADAYNYGERRKRTSGARV